MSAVRAPVYSECKAEILSKSNRWEAHARQDEGRAQGASLLYTLRNGQAENR